MVKKRQITVTNKLLGILILVALFIQYVLPKAGLGGFNNVAVILYLIVAIYLIFF